MNLKINLLQEKRSELELHVMHLKDELRHAGTRRLQAEAETDRLKLEVSCYEAFHSVTSHIYLKMERLKVHQLREAVTRNSSGAGKFRIILM